jgi:hypothetical protein
MFDLLEPWDVRALSIKENSGFATPTLGWHISMFRGYQILFSIRNPYMFGQLGIRNRIEYRYT